MSKLKDITLVPQQFVIKIAGTFDDRFTVTTSLWDEYQPKRKFTEVSEEFDTIEEVFKHIADTYIEATVGKKR